jgi:DNA-binding transcriptional MerR regulator
MQTDSATLSIREAAAALGVSAHTLRYYERARLLRPVERGANAHRRYSAQDLDWLRFLIRLRSTGMPIARIHEYARLANAGETTAEARRQLLIAHERDVRAQLQGLEANLAAIRAKIAAYEALGMRTAAR